MKRTILSSLTVLGVSLGLTASTLQAQTLQFSQVILLTQSQSVPAGKVWKVTNMLPSTALTSSAGGTSSGQSSSTEQTISVNGNTVYLGSSHARYSGAIVSISDRGGSSAGTGSRPMAAAMSSSQVLLNGALWFPAGTTLAPGNGLYGISVLEFTVVP